VETNNRILVIDDDLGVQSSYREILQPEMNAALFDQGRELFGCSGGGQISPDLNYELTLADNGESGIDAVKMSIRDNLPFAVAFIDLKMPGINGLATAKRIWQLDARINIAIVTALNCITPENTVKLLERQDILFLNKPFTRDEIRYLAQFMTYHYNLEQREAFWRVHLEQKVEKRALELKQSQQNASERLRRAMEGVIKAMTLMLESKNPYTAGHQHRVSVLATAMATEMQLKPDRVEGVRIAGLLHDIGKISVPSEILSWPGKLSKAEMQIIKQHPELGYDILKTIDFSFPVAEIEYQHHERLDGSGYPRGLKEAEILPEARILAVADVVEAMVSRRPYRAALGLDMALAEIDNGRGVRFDADVVDACVRLFKEKGFQW